MNASHKRSLRVGLGFLASFLLIFNTAGFAYYWSMYHRIDRGREELKKFEREREELNSKISLLEKSVIDTESMASKLAGLVGSERMPLEKGVGPLSLESFNVQKKTETLEATNGRLDQLDEKNLSLQEKLDDLLKIQEDKLTYHGSTPSIWPVKGWVTSDFGSRISPFSLVRDFHQGLDIAAQWGTPIVAPADGVVTFAGYRGGYGKMVIIDHGFGVVTKFGHTSEILVKEGDKVAKGSKLAKVGSTGHSTGPHLHYEVHVDGVAVDPMKYILQ